MSPRLTREGDGKGCTETFQAFFIWICHSINIIYLKCDTPWFRAGKASHRKTLLQYILLLPFRIEVHVFSKIGTVALCRSDVITMVSSCQIGMSLEDSLFLTSSHPLLFRSNKFCRMNSINIFCSLSLASLVPL